MPEILPPPIWVNNKQLLQQLRDDLVTQSRVAVDTESNSLHAFREQVCLVQFSTTNADYLVDPLALKDLSILAPIFSDPKIEKIFHAAEYDLVCLRRDFNFSFANLFDTMQAARILGYPAVGLDRLLGDKFKIQTDKRHQKANWAARPLTKEQIHYARLDTHYLFALRDVLEDELRKKDRLTFAKEDFVRACLPHDEPKQKVNGESWGRFAARKDLSLRELTILAYLCKWRDREAEKLNRPPYKVIMDDVFVLMSKNPPVNKVDLSGMGLSEKQINLWGEGVLAAIRRGMEAPLVERKQIEAKNDAVLRRLEKLKLWRKNLGLEMGVESDVILPKPYVSALAENPPMNAAELAQLMKDSPSRVEKYGAQILKLLGVKNAN
ncbi:ribonuclease D [Candidatus Villigracilis saccharophilus]|uniref:ribonuclease D n=1 Tax=Candidatus Villigracilis saccharophilus TaxID=3140684 RepID=UPI0031370D4B|nr:ribonuclease D [Anaerolineales bacterium]